MFTGLLTVAVLLPIVAAVLILLFGRDARTVRIFAVAVSVVEFLLTLFVFLNYDTSEGADQFQMVDRVVDWIPIESFEVQYYLAVDGLSAPLVMLTGLLGMVAIFASWTIGQQRREQGEEPREREYFMWLLALQGAVVGVFTSLDFLLFFVFWELELIPMFFLISVWGSGRREYSAMKFLIFTILGSAFMLVGILVLYFSTGSFDMTELPALVRQAGTGLPALAVFLLLFVAFAVKLPVWPLHTWLPDAHTDAPTAASVMLAGVLLKMGAYGMFRLGAILPDVLRDVSWALAALGVINILYGASVVLRQTDMKRLIAFSSISHMGFILLGLASAVGVAGSVSPIGLTGASLQMFTHGVITGMLFLLVGYVYERAHTRHIPDLGGLVGRMPVLGAALLVAGLASLGLPSTAGFVSEIHVFLGTFPVWSWMTALGAFGVVLTAGYILWMIQRVMLGPLNPRFADLKDATPLELVPIAALIIAIMVVGIFPSTLTDVFSTGITPIVESLQMDLTLSRN